MSDDNSHDIQRQFAIGEAVMFIDNHVPLCGTVVESHQCTVSVKIDIGNSAGQIHHVATSQLAYSEHGQPTQQQSESIIREAMKLANQRIDTTLYCYDQIGGMAIAYLSGTHYTRRQAHCPECHSTNITFKHNEARWNADVQRFVLEQSVLVEDTALCHQCGESHFKPQWFSVN